MNCRPYILLLSLFLVSCGKQKHETYRLWYNKPAQYFEESLPLGNGRSGACIFGGTKKETIYLNDATLWAGEPVDPYMNPEAYKHLPAIREALANEDYRLADRLNRNLQGKFSESYAPLGTINLVFNHMDTSNYYRALDLGKALASVSYEVDGITYSRKYLISHPDQVMLIKLSADKKAVLNFSLEFESLLKYSSCFKDNVLQIDGYAPYHAEPNYRGKMPDAVLFDENRGTRFSTYVGILNEGGNVIYTDSTISVSDCDEAILFVSIATSFNGFDKDPVKQGIDNQSVALAHLGRAMDKGFDRIFESHIIDHQSFFNKMDLRLGESTGSDLPTDERLKKYTEGADDKELEVLYFQFGRYLLISSSRTDGVPANLQGIWNPYMRPPWSSNYTMNINLEENYWLAEIANLSEMHQPLLGFIENLSKTGSVTAKTFYGINRGWAACHNSDIWAMSNPVGDFGKGHPVWACWNMSGPWLATHLWQNYLFSLDTGYLKHRAYPLMKGAAEFCLHFLVEDQQGYLITSPSTSPENQYITPDGYMGATLYGSTADLAMIRECFMQTIAASEELGTDESFRDSLGSALEKLYPYQIGRKGNLQEWYHDWEDADPKHRHQSHLFGLYPGQHITPVGTPELANACRKTLEIKGDETTGWSKGWRINLWARLKDGERAYKMYRELLSYVEPDGAEKTEYPGRGGTYPNLLDAHPPFQIDGNFGGAAGLIEMLIQSHNGVIQILPALPDAWPEGEIRGVCARGGFVCSFNWADGKLLEIEILSKAGKKCKLVYGDREISFQADKYASYRFNDELKPID